MTYDKFATVDDILRTLTAWKTRLQTTQPLTPRQQAAQRLKVRARFLREFASIVTPTPQAKEALRMLEIKQL